MSISFGRLRPMADAQRFKTDCLLQTLTKSKSSAARLHRLRHSPNHPTPNSSTRATTNSSKTKTQSSCSSSNKSCKSPIASKSSTNWCKTSKRTMHNSRHCSRQEMRETGCRKRTPKRKANSSKRMYSKTYLWGQALNENAPIATVPMHNHHY